MTITLYKELTFNCYVFCHLFDVVCPYVFTLTYVNTPEKS